jgi:hypothetical protein
MQILFNDRLYADYYTFYVQDRNSRPDYEALASNENFERMLGVGERVLAISTRRYEYVPVMMSLHEQSPGYDPAACDKINECSIEVKGGLQCGTVISGFLNDLSLEPGIYRVRILYKNLASVVSDFEGADEYELQFWPDTQLRQPMVIK